MNLFDELKTLLARLDSEKVDYALCGGLAMAVHALPRATLDIDIMIDRQDLEKVKSIAWDLGFELDAGLMSFREGKVRIYRVTKIEKDSGETLVLDLLLVTETTSDAWNTRTRMEWDQGQLSVVSAEGLIQMKSMRRSGQDEDDIKHLRSIMDED